VATIVKNEEEDTSKKGSDSPHFLSFLLVMMREVEREKNIYLLRLDINIMFFITWFLATSQRHWYAIFLREALYKAG